MPRARYLDMITAVFVTTLIVSNVVASKTALLFGFPIGVGIFVFPISYIFGDILTEVYGYAASRRVIWLGFASVGLAAVIFQLCVWAPPAPGFAHQAAFEQLLGQSPFILLASMIAYFFGEFFNSFTLARMKVLTAGRMLWARTIGSTVVGEAVDSAIFYPLAFVVFPMLFGRGHDAWDTSTLMAVMVNNYAMKVALEAAATPITYRLVAALKRAEQIDVYDRETNFNPFVFQAPRG